jgi:pimeloyl-ACP methyl ester carboxylesterase
MPVMVEQRQMSDLMITRGGVRVAVEQAGAGAVPVVLLHGLTATRRYVVMGSRSLERSGHRVIAYDARGHGRSDPAATPSAYGYDELSRDLEAVLDALEVDRAVLAGASMGAHTLLAALVVITPAYDGSDVEDPRRLKRWDALSQGLRTGGVDGFVEAYGVPTVAPEFRDTVLTVVRQRLSLHKHPDALADALSAVPRSRPFAAVSDLAAISVPTAVVASGDEADPEHPKAVGEAYAVTIPGARLVQDEPGRSPVAWQGSQLSKVIAETAARASDPG